MSFYVAYCVICVVGCALCSVPVSNGDDEGLEQDSMYERVPDTFRKQVTSFSQQMEAPKLPPVRSRRPSDDPATVQHRASSVATLPSTGAPPSPLLRARLLSSPSVKNPPPPSYPAPAAPPPSYPAPNPPDEYEDELNALYARPEPPTGGRTMSSSYIQEKMSVDEARKKAATLPVKASLSYGGPRSPVSLGPLPALPETAAKVSLSKQPKKEEEEEVEDPRYDTTQSVSAVNPDYDCLETGRF